ncbi:MAG: hypothetical protein ABIZ52_01495 [Candidatus Limnocylindrales bacterium]
MKEGGSTGSNFHKLLGRGLTDDAFREALMDSERQAYALESMGIEPTVEVREALNAAIEGLNNLARSETLGGGPQEVA